MTNQKELTIIVTTYNSSKIISSCLEKINFEQFDVCVVDNASLDNTVAIVSEKFPQAKILSNNKNLGYGRGNNTALRQINTKYALILNPDAFIFENEIKQIMDLMNKNPIVTLAAPLLLTRYPAQEEDIKKQLEIVESRAIKNQNYADFKSVEYLIGAIVFMRMSTFQEIGFFDENIFLYYEDDEISWRNIVNKNVCAVVTKCYGYHIGHGSSGSNFRGVYKRFWHRALSKFYWKEKRQGRFRAVKSAVKLSFFFLLLAIINLLIFNLRKSVEKFASFAGTIAYLIGLKAFDKNDNPRG